MQTDILLEGLCFPEGPRWRDGALWFSDMHDQRVKRMTADGAVADVCTVPHWPSGLGWLPDGTLLVVSMTDRRVLRWDGERLALHADLSDLASFHCNDMVVDAHGRAYVGNFGFDLHNGAAQRNAELILVEPDGTARCVNDEVLFPNGTVITPDDATLIVAETLAGRLTAFDLDSNGDLSHRRIWAQLPKGAVPDGICLDAGGGIWSASPSTNNCIRQIEGGAITHEISLERGAFACMIGDDQLYILTSTTSKPDQCKIKRGARVEVYPAPYPAAGRP